MNYHHIYHAGSFSDVFKHVMLMTLIQSMLKKESAFCFLDTHAGAGCYDLLSSEAKKNPEFTEGIQKIIAAENPPTIMRDYLDAIVEINHRLTSNPEKKLRYYPGSPLFAHYLLRNDDRLLLSELQPAVLRSLKRLFKKDKKVSAHLLDGYQALKAFLPPKERRGLILIDPPYEKSDEIVKITHALSDAIKQFEKGIYAIWYPIKQESPAILFQRALKNVPSLKIEITLYSELLPNYLNGCGMLIINPPWQLKESIQSFLPWLWKKLSINKGGKYLIE